jgi:hypothetical protein
MIRRHGFAIAGNFFQGHGHALIAAHGHHHAVVIVLD